MEATVSVTTGKEKYSGHNERIDNFEFVEKSSGYNSNLSSEQGTDRISIQSESLVDSVSWQPPLHNRDDDKILDPVKKSGIFGASSNLVNSIVGAGIIGIPYAMKNTGLVVGIVLLFAVAYLTDKSLRVIVEAAKFHPKLQGKNISSFEELMSYPFGKFGSSFILLNMFIMAYGAMVAYLVIIKDTVPTILGLALEAGIEREIILIITSIAIMLPLSMQKDMASLAFTSVLSVTADIILVCFVVIFSPMHESVNSVGGVGELLKQDSIKPTLFIGLGILSTAMACQHSAFIVYGSLENGTASRWASVTNSSIAISVILCAILGVCGYIGFLDETQGDVLNNFEVGSVAANGARTLLAITMLFTYPMEAFVGRHVLISLIYNGETATHGNSRNCLPNRTRGITIGLYILTLIPALIFDDLGPVLSFTGSLGGSCISYIAPGAVFLGVNGEEFMLYCQEMLSHYNMKRGRFNQDENQGIELPVVGNADAIIQHSSNIQNNENTLDLPVEGNKMDMVTLLATSKPLWWYLLGYPIWYWIASRGYAGMNRKLIDFNDDIAMNNCNVAIGDQPNVIGSSNTGGKLVPTKSDFHIAIFFIVFGFIAGCAGVASNIYIQIMEAQAN